LNKVNKNKVCWHNCEGQIQIH